MGRVFCRVSFGETIASLQPSRPRPPIVRTVALSSRYLYCPAGVTYRAWSACRRVRRISPWRSGENNGRTFYYQIDLWISNRVPTTEVYTAASGPRHALSAVKNADVSQIFRAPRVREANMFIVPRGELTREEHVKADSYCLDTLGKLAVPAAVFYGQLPEQRL